ncbi:MAG: hypothetical protein GY842_06400 [bacterium]|nr:hypothetical protein [bacterium]
MLRSIQGVYRDGTVELAEVPRDVDEPTPVIVTLLEATASGSSAGDVDPAQAAEVRARLATFAADWDSPEMAIYDDYDAAKLHPR